MPAIGLRASTRLIAAPIVLTLFGISLLVAGAFSTDPALGYPRDVPIVHTVHGMFHGFAGLAAFSTLPISAFLIAGWFARKPAMRRWAWYSFAVGALMIATFIAGWTWIAMLALHLIRPDELALSPA